MAWICSHIYSYMWDMITDPCPNCSGGVAKLPLKLEHGWVFVCNSFLWPCFKLHTWQLHVFSKKTESHYRLINFFVVLTSLSKYAHFLHTRKLRDYFRANQIDRFVQERRNSIANALELRLSYTNISKCIYQFSGLTNPERWVTSERCKQQITGPHVWRVSSQTWRPRIQGAPATWLQTSTLSRGQVSSDKWPRDRGTPCEEKGTPTSWF